MLPNVATQHLATCASLAPSCICSWVCAGCLQVSDGDLDLYTGLDADGGDLLDHIGGGVQVDEALVDPAHHAKHRKVG